MVNLVQNYLSDSVNRTPRKTAVWDKEKTLSFLELEEKSNRLARFLKKKGIQKGDRVAFLFSKSINSFISIFGILKADAIYVPINHQAPEARISQIIEDASPKIILRGEEEKEYRVESAEALLYENNSDDIAYILYTSGSTGKPKGVMISHGNIINATDWAVKELGISQNDKMSQHPPLHFDLSTFDIYCAIKSGAALYLVPEEFSLFPRRILNFIEERKLTIWNSVPSVMVQMSLSGVAKAGRMPELKKVFFNGEAFPTKFLIEWMKNYPDKIFVNMYGPTETTVQCSFYPLKEIPKDMSKIIPIGKACENVEIFAVNEDGLLAAVGETGELYVSGKGVGKGYWNNSQKTEESFIPHPFDIKKGITYKTGDLVRLMSDDNYEFVGRKDNQVKVRGNRIELGDVDSALYSLPYVKEAGTIIAQNSELGAKLVSFVDSEVAHDTDLVKKDLAKIIPHYMIPSEIIFSKLPKTSTGKIDKQKLKEEYGRKN